MQKFFLLAGSLLMALTVAIGAFGAHGLKDILQKTQRIDTFETAVRYQFYHSLGILFLGLLLIHFQHKLLNYAGYSFLIGIIIFSGSLYILSLTGIRWLGAITPIGGLAFITGWVLVFVALLQYSSNPN
jgi:uncharacterized membrane protein YgdD (TMEM256/DUF423 family)